MSGRLLAIGDIHGCGTALATLLSAVDLVSDDSLIVLGDVVDRGSDVKGCIDLLIETQSRCQLTLLLGNHEEMLFDAVDTGGWLKDWLDFGGVETLSSYGESSCLENIPETHWKFLRSGRDWHETETAIFVHANLQAGVPLPDQTTQWLRWHKLRGNEPRFAPGKRVICGHTAQHSGLPKVFPGWVNLDTYCYGGEWLSCLDLTTDTLWQANEFGKLRGPEPLEPNGR